jgi:hypothetical protein
MADPDNTADTQPQPVWRFGVAVALAMIVAGVMVMVSLIWISGRGGGSACDGPVNLGDEANLRETVVAEPVFQAVSSRCQLWLTTDTTGALVAYKATLPGRDCTVRWDIGLESWQCGSAEIAPEDLARWPLSIDTRGGRPTVVIDFGSDPDTATSR